ncbi:hypothetical protein AGMMS49982_23630 [Bacteroidia bacterium]|nr:hypothetical protein AGMMS49982_23630 [Bacteroidia bacterium]
MFNRYNSKGNLCIIIDKINGKKYQLHFELQEFRDAENTAIKGNMLLAIGATGGLANFCLQKLNEYMPPNDSAAYYRLGKIYENWGDYAGAVDCYEKAIALNPMDDDLWFDLGNVHAAFWNHREALQCYQTMSYINPTSTAGYHNAGYSYMDLGDYEKALECFHKLLDSAVDDKNCYCDMIGTVHFIQENYVEALIWHQRAYDMGLEDSLLQMGNCYAGLNDYVKAVRCLQAYIRTDSTQADGWFALGTIYNDMGEYEKALYCFQRGIAIEPNSFSIHDMGTTYHHLGDDTQAIKCYQKALKIYELDSKWIHEANYARILHDMGEAYYGLAPSLKASKDAKEGVGV